MEQAHIRTPRPVGRMGDRQALCFDGGHVAVVRYEAKNSPCPKARRSTEGGSRHEAGLKPKTPIWGTRQCLRHEGGGQSQGHRLYHAQSPGDELHSTELPKRRSEVRKVGLIPFRKASSAWAGKSRQHRAENAFNNNSERRQTMWYPKHSNQIRGKKKEKKEKKKECSCHVEVRRIHLSHAENLSYPPFGHRPASLDAGFPVCI